MDDLSAAVVVWLGHGRSSAPRADDAAARAVVTSTDPDHLVARVRSLVTESLDAPVDWAGLSLAEAGRAVADEMARRHPELSSSALDALAWNFSYAWR